MSAVYVYAAIAKMNYDWMVLAIPLTHWLPKRIGKFEGDIPDNLSNMFDNLMDSKLVAQFMSVTGMLYDLLIPALFSAGGLWRNLGYVTVKFVDHSRSNQRDQQVWLDVHFSCYEQNHFSDRYLSLSVTRFGNSLL